MASLPLTRASCHWRVDGDGFAIVVSVGSREEKIPGSLPIEWKGRINSSGERPAIQTDNRMKYVSV